MKTDDIAKCYTSKHTQLVNEIQNQPWFNVKLMINSVSTLNVIAHQLTNSKAKITFHEYCMLHLNASSNLDNSIGIKCYIYKHLQCKGSDVAYQRWIDW